MGPKNKIVFPILVTALIFAIGFTSTSCSTIIPFFTDTVPSLVEDIIDDIAPQEPEHTINLGEEVNLGSQTIEASGGTVDIDKPDDPLDGFEIEVPPDAYGESKKFDVSYAPITGHDFGENFNPITPMITVENGGEYADEVMLVTIPVDIPDDSFAMAFYFDKATGKLEGVPPVSETHESITVATRHFTDLLVTIIDENVLAQDIDSGFRPGVDDWQFVNRGSYISPGGHCWGQSLAAMWYYCEEYKNGAPHLYDLYDNNGGVATPDLWQDDSWGYRLASTVQEDGETDQLLYRTGKYISESSQLTYRAFAYSILLTGEPQYVRIRQSAGSGIHAMVVYRVAGNTLYIADPNYPGRTDRKIELTGGQFTPYNSGDNFEAIQRGEGKAYDKIDYLAKTTFIKWDEIGKRWQELESGTIGSDRFPGYNIKIQKDDGTTVDYTEGFKTDEESVFVKIESQVPGTNLACWVWESGVRLNPGANGCYALSPGRNQWGVEIVGKPANNGWKYVDFVYIDIYTADLVIEPAAVGAEPGDTISFTAHTDNLPAHPRYSWDFGDGISGDEANSSQVSHQFTEAGRYTVSLALFDDDTGEIIDRATAEVNIQPESKDLLNLLHNFSVFNLTFNSTNIYQDWLVSKGESTVSNNNGMDIPWAWGGDNMIITWEGTSFTGTLLHLNPDDRGRIDEVNGIVSADGTTVESIVFSYRNRDYGSNWVSNSTVNLEFTNMPLNWYDNGADQQSELRFELHGSEVQSHVTRVEYHADTYRNGNLESSRDYVSTDWSQTASLYLTLRK